MENKTKPEEKDIKNIMQNKRRVLFGSIALASVIGIGFIVPNIDNIKSEFVYETSNREAVKIAKETIKSYLKAPSSAKFSKTELTRLYTSIYVEGVVESENTYGTMIQNKYNISISSDGKDIINVEFNDGMEFNDSMKDTLVSSRYSKDEMEIIDNAMEYVKTQLKAPSTAQFCTYDEFELSTTSSGGFRVEGYVDSQNGFGAMIRTNFSAILDSDGKTGKAVFRK